MANARAKSIEGYPMSYAGSSFDEALQRLSVAMGVNNQVGTQEQAAWTSGRRVVWTPVRMRYQAPHEQPGNGKACAEVWIVCDVEVQATDWSALEDATNKLQVALYQEFSENAFERLGDVSVAGGDIDSPGFGTIGQIALLFPVYVHRYGRANITTTEQAATVVGPLGT